MKKKVILCVIMICGMFLLGLGTSYAASLPACSGAFGDAEIDDKIPDLVSKAVLAIQIVVPVLLIIFGMIDLMKAITSQKDDEIKKGQQTFVKRLVAGAIVFFVFVVVKLVVSLVADKNSSVNIMNCASCFLNGTGDSACNTR